MSNLPALLSWNVIQGRLFTRASALLQATEANVCSHKFNRMLCFFSSPEERKPYFFGKSDGIQRGPLGKRAVPRPPKPQPQETFHELHGMKWSEKFG